MTLLDVISAAVEEREYVAEEVRDARRELRMTQQAFADAVGVTRTSIAMWEVGKTPPRKTHLLLIRSLVSAHRVTLGLKLQRVHRCFCYEAGYEAGQAGTRSSGDCD